MPKTLRLPLRIVFYREGDSWVARCLEFDLIGDGETKQEAMEALCEAVNLQIQATIEHKNAANLFSPADGKFFEMFARGNDVATGELQLKQLSSSPAESFEIEECEYREYVGGDLCGV